jgi:hypothetical protein
VRWSGRGGGRVPERGGTAKKAGGRRKLSDAEKRRRAAARKAQREEAAEQARREALRPLELAAEDERRTLKGAARTSVSGRLYDKIFREWTEGMSIMDLSERHGLSRRRIQEVVDDYKTAGLAAIGVGDTLFSVKQAQQLVLQRSAAVSQYTRLAAEVTEPAMASVKLGYLKQRDAALTAYVELLQELHWLPRHLGTINVQMDALQMAEVMLEVMDQQGVDLDTQRVIVEAIELRVIRRGDRLALAGVGPDLEGVAADMDNGGEVHDDVGPGDSGDSAPGGAGDPGAAAPGAGAGDRAAA